MQIHRFGIEPQQDMRRPVLEVGNLLNLIVDPERFPEKADDRARWVHHVHCHQLLPGMLVEIAPRQRRLLTLERPRAPDLPHQPLHSLPFLCTGPK